MDKILAEAITLHEKGFAVHWLRPNSKIPIRQGWATEEPLTAAELIREFRSEFNVGFRPGKWSVVDGSEICVLDVDIRGGEAFKAEAYAVAESIAGADYTAISGSGIGRHYYLRFPVGGSPDRSATTLRESDVWVHQTSWQVVAPRTEGAKPAWVIELLSTGKNVVMPPSVHPETGNHYQ